MGQSSVLGSIYNTLTENSLFKKMQIDIEQKMYDFEGEISENSYRKST